MSKVEKYQLSNDVFSVPLSAQARSRDLGFDGAIHVYDVDGQAYYMPGPTHEAYLEGMGYGEEPEEEKKEILEMFLEVMERLTKEDTMAKTKDTPEGTILKIDDEQRMVYGWASVITEDGVPVKDRQGDIIEADTLVKATNAFMTDVRVGKAMHEGEKVGEFIHSLPLTKELGDALGIQSNREGWIVAMKVYDDAIWAKVKSGELRAFSIGGRAQREEV